MTNKWFIKGTDIELYDARVADAGRELIFRPEPESNHTWLPIAMVESRTILREEPPVGSFEGNLNGSGYWLRLNDGWIYFSNGRTWPNRLVSWDSLQQSEDTVPMELVVRDGYMTRD